MKLKDRAFRFGPAVVLLVVTAALLITAGNYDPQTRAMPMVVGSLTALLLIIELLAQRQDNFGERLRRIFSGSSQALADIDPKKVSLRREIGAFFWVLAFVVLAVLLGFYIAIPLYVFTYLTLHARKSPVKAAIAAVAIVGLLYLMFQVFLGYPIFGGILFGDFM